MHPAMLAVDPPVSPSSPSKKIIFTQHSISHSVLRYIRRRRSVTGEKKDVADAPAPPSSSSAARAHSPAESPTLPGGALTGMLLGKACLSRSTTAPASTKEAARLKAKSTRYLNSMSSSAMQFTHTELFNALDEDKKGYLNTTHDLPIAFEICLGTSPKLSQAFATRVAGIYTQLNSEQFCRVVGEFASELNEAKRAGNRSKRPPSLGESGRWLTNHALELHQAEADKKKHAVGKAAVFLGGACNPTTWRRDVAIPVLEAAGISYFNPQVDDWRPELVEIEAKAKEGAKVLLFVVNGQTRGVASMVEAAELIARGRQVVLVLQDITSGTANEKHMSMEEVKDLNRGRAYLANVASRHNLETFGDVSEACQHVAAFLTVDVEAESLEASRIAEEEALM